MKIFIDTNVLLDVLCKREKFYADSLEVFRCCETKLVTGYISSLSVVNIMYILRKELSGSRTDEILKMLTSLFTVADLLSGDLIKAADLPMRDYEDALQYIAVERVKSDFIVTRNIKDFSLKIIPAIQPFELRGKLFS